MPYSLTQEQVESITPEELLYGTQRFLPCVEDIPLEHWGWFKGVERNIYFRIAEAMYIGEQPPAGEVSLNAGFTGKGMKEFLKAHMICIHPEYQHRIAGMAYMMSLICTIKEKTNG